MRANRLTERVRPRGIESGLERAVQLLEHLEARLVVGLGCTLELGQGSRRQVVSRIYLCVWLHPFDYDEEEAADVDFRELVFLAVLFFEPDFRVVFFPGVFDVDPDD